jgi:hypothetical protein
MMLFQATFGKLPVWLLPLVVYCALLAGCIAEPPTPVQVVPEIIVPPATISFSAPVLGYINHSSPPSGTMLVKWNRSAADTQLNFKGYFVQVWTADTTNYYLRQIYDLKQLVDTVTVLRPYTAPGVPVKRTDTFYTFTSSIGASPNSGIPLGTYAITVWGEKTSAKDTTIYSLDSSQYIGLFDPLPLESPTNLRATSYGSNNVLLRWTAPVTDKDTGLFQYVVYYRDTSLSTFDTGHIAALVPKGGNDSMILVSPPAANSSTSLTAEWPYEFWVKAERNDSTFFYGADMYGPDTNHVVWAGAEACPKTYPGFDTTLTGDTGSWGGFHNSLYFGSNNGQWDMVDDSTIGSPNGGSAQVELMIDSPNVTLKTMNGAMFLTEGATARMDTTPSLDSLFYTTPLALIANPSLQFKTSSVPLPTYPNSTGIVLYLMIIDQSALPGKPEYARLFIQRQKNGTFLNASNGLHCQSSFQPGVDLNGDAHLPFY